MEIIEVFEACIDGTLDRIDLEFEDNAAVCVVLASAGYPGSYAKGKVITGLEEAAKTGAVVFHAGTKRAEDGAIVTAGGRVLGVTARGITVRDAVDRAYAAVRRISFDGMQYRKDIAHRALERE